MANYPMLAGKATGRHKVDLSGRPKRYSRNSLLRRELPFTVRFRLIPCKPGQRYGNPHPLLMTIYYNRAEGASKSDVFLTQSAVVDPDYWSAEEQRCTIADSPLNDTLRNVAQQVTAIYWAQQGAGLDTCAKSLKLEFSTGRRPVLINGKWGYPRPDLTPKIADRLRSELTADSPLDAAYRAYVAYLRAQKGTHAGLSEVSLGRWDRGLMLLSQYAHEMDTPMPVVGSITVGWAKRFHRWMQSQTGGLRCLKPVSVGQATRFILKVSNVLDWLIEDDLIDKNPISRATWERCPNKEVQFLEPHHVHQLLNLNWSGTEEVALWWFCLMCCTGLDYPDAIAYARNRKAFEVRGRAGRKIVGKRNKPPHAEYHLPLLDEVDELFTRYPQGPADYSPQCVNRYTAKIEKALDIDWRITAKTARKTFGCLMLAAGHRIADVSLMLGHRRIATTETYYVKVKGDSIDRSMGRVKVDIRQLAGLGGLSHV